jgi:hypothetical protein
MGTVLLLVAGSTALTACGTSSAADPASCQGGAPRLTVTGTGTASAAPDLLTVTIELDVTASSAALALAQDNTDTAAVLAAFTQGGVAPKDLQTTNLSVQPDYVTVHGRQVPSGYEVDDTVTAMVRRLDTAGDLLDAVVAAGGNALSIDSLDFSLANPEGVQNNARTAAVHQAVGHAGSMAVAAGDHLGPLCSLRDNSSTTEEPLPSTAYGALRQAALPAAVPLRGGTQQATAQVTLVYALAQGHRSRTV